MDGLRIEALGVGHGDGIVVRWTDRHGAAHVGLVDGGPARLYASHLRPHLETIAGERGEPQVALDFVCVSHIDDDHIGGVARLFTEIRRERNGPATAPARPKRLWFNSWDQLGLAETTTSAAGDEPVIGASVRQGRDLRDVARLLRVDGNHPAGGALLAGTTFELADLRIDVVGPGPQQLEALRTTWREAEGAPDVLGAAYADRKIPNLSSIAFLAGDGRRTALLTGDARGDHLLAGLGAGGHLRDGRLHVDVFKLPHHGSINNVDTDLFDAVTADHYIVSADGVTHGLPNMACLEMLLDSRPRGDEYEILLTNPMPRIEAALEAARRGRSVRITVRREGERGVAA